MNYLSIEKASIVNGKGIRVVLWVSGCTHHCKGCHNPEAWDFKSGKLFDSESQKELYSALSKPYIQGITFSGGNPLEFENQLCVKQLIEDIKHKFPTKDIWLYTGLTLSPKDFCNCIDDTDSSLFNDYTSFRKSILQQCDVVVDGAYIQELRDTTLPFRGSSNQRIINVKKTIQKQQIIFHN